MKFLCLICAEKMMEHMPEADAERHYEEYREFTEAIRKSGHFIGVNRLLPPDAATTVRVRRRVVDARYLETSIPATHTPSTGWPANPASDTPMAPIDMK